MTSCSVRSWQVVLFSVAGGCGDKGGKLGKGKGMAVEEPAAGAEAAERAAGDDARRVTEFFGHAEEEDVDVSAWW